VFVAQMLCWEENKKYLELEEELRFLLRHRALKYEDDFPRIPVQLLHLSYHTISGL
jgi:hypothetical protein